MSNYVAGKHHIGVLRSDGTTKWGFRLAKDSKGFLKYRAYDDEYLATNVITGTPSYSNLPPEKELLISMQDWRGGFGQEFFDSLNPKKYYTAIGGDLRFKGMAIAGPLATTVTKPSSVALTITNADMELDSDWTNGTRDSTQAHGGTYSQSKLASAGSITLQNMAWDNAYRKQTWTFRAWLYQEGGEANQAQIGINDGVGTTWSTVFAGTTTWTQVSVTRTLDVAATQLRIQFRHVGAGGGNKVYMDDADFAVQPTTGSPTCKGVIFNSEHYAGFGNILGKEASDGTAFTTVGSFPANITALVVFQVSGTDYLFIFLGTSTNYWYMVAAETFTESTATNKTYQYAAMNLGSSPTLFANDGVNTIRSTTNPLNGGTAWSAQTIVDASANPIKALFSEANTLYIAKTDRLYYLDSAGAVQRKTEETAVLTATNQGLAALSWHGDLFYNAGTQSLWRYDTSASGEEWISPAKYASNQTEFVGEVQAMAGDEEYLYAVIDNSTKIEVMAGRDEEVDGTTAWRWHGSLAEITLTGASIAWVAGENKKRLYIGSTTAAEALSVVPLTTKYGNITGDTDYTFKTGTYFIPPWFDAGFRNDTKAYIKMTCKLGHAYDADIYWTAAYEVLEDSTWTDIGNFVGTSASRIQTIYIPVDSSSNKPKSTMMRFRFTAVTDDTAKTPILLDFSVQAILYPTKRRIIDCEIVDEDDMLNNQGLQERGGGATTKAVIEEAKAATWPVTYYEFGATKYVKFLQAEEFVVTDEVARALSRHYRLILQEVTLS